MAQTMNNFLIEPIRVELEASVEPLKIHILVRALQLKGWLTDYDLSQPEPLFAVNFLAQNALYQLQKEYLSENKYLSVSSLHIELITSPNTMPSTNTENNALRDYYLNWNNLKQADKTYINQLLDQFWQGYVASDELAHAMAVMSLPEDVNIGELKAHYRRLAMQYHPDRGGCNQQFREITVAYHTLLKHLKPRE